MAPKKTKGGQGPISPPVPAASHAELKQAQNAYQQISKKTDRKLFSAIEDLRCKGSHLSRITVLRLLLEKNDELMSWYKSEKGMKNEGYNKWLQSVLGAYKPEWERPLGDDRMSCTLVTALAACWNKCVEQTTTSMTDEDVSKVLSLFQRSFNKGFSKEGWSKDWVDPKSEMLAATEVKDAFVPERPTSVGMLAEQLKQLAAIYFRVHQAVSNSTSAAQYSLPTDVVKLPWMKQAKDIALEAAKATPAAAESKQLDPKMLHQQATREQQQQQQQQHERGRGRDTDRRDRDVKRGAGKEAEDKLKNKELQAAREAEEALRVGMQKVLTHLESKLLSGKQLDKQQHLQALQECSSVPFDTVKTFLKGRKDVAKDNPEAACLLEKCKVQFGAANPSDGMLLGQLRALKGGAGYLYLDEALMADTSNTHKQQQEQRTWDSFEAFEEYVRSSYLTAPVDYKGQSALVQGAPGLSEVYSLQMDDQLADAEAKGLMDGDGEQVPNGLQQSNAWVQAFSEECPIARYLRIYTTTMTEDFFTQAGSDEQARVRLSNATGFALLQLQRGEVPADWQQLSETPPWVVLAYHTLKLCMPGAGGREVTPQDYVTFNFWGSEMACIDEYQRVISSDRDAYPDSTDGAVSDSTVMLQMLHGAQLLHGPLLLAVHLYLLKNAGVQLALSTLDDVAQLDKALNKLSLKHQQQLRLSLFQVLDNVFASLPRYQQFLRDLQEQVLKPTQVPVHVIEGRQQGGVSLALSPEYYMQACLAAAMPSEYHTACCSKHAIMRGNEEAVGQRFSRFDASIDDYDSFICDDQRVYQESGSVAQRYLVKPAQAAQAAQQAGIEVGTKEGLKALLEQLYLGPDRHPHQSKIGVQCPAESAIPERSTWDKVRTDLLLAQQLAMHRQQLAKLIESHTKEVDDKQLGKRDVERMMRSLFASRVAGHHWVLEHLQLLLQEQQEQLRKEDSRAQEQLRMWADAPEKPGKGGKDNNKEREKELNDKLSKIHTSISNLDNALSMVKTYLANNASEAESYPDLIRAQHSAATGREDTIKLMLHLLVNELLSSAPVDANGALAQLNDSLRLARLMLFDLDTEIMHHVLTARRRVLLSAWDHKQVPVAVLLAAEAIKAVLHADAHQAAVDALIAEVEEEKKDKKPAQQPAGKKKKKKKGPAAKSAVRVVEVDEEEEEDVEQQAAAAADVSLTEQEPEEQHEQGSLDGEEMVDITKVMASYAEQRESSSSSSRRRRSKDDSKVTATAAAGQDTNSAAAAAAGQRGKDSAAVSGRGSMQGQSSAYTEKQHEAEKYVYYTQQAICGRCGEWGHRYGDCSAVYCSTCSKWGHATGACKEACSRCGKQHHPNAHNHCRILQCKECQLWGHVFRDCPNVQCDSCGRLGHRRAECRGCRKCGLPMDKGHQCPAITAAAAAASPQAPPAAGDSRVSTSSRGRQRQHAPATAAAAALKQPYAAGNVKLLSISDEKYIEERLAQLMERLFNSVGETAEYAAKLASDSDEKHAILARIPDADLAEIFQQPNIATALEDVYAHFVNTTWGRVLPAELHQDAAEAFEAALQQFPGLLNPGWRSSTSWGQVEKRFLMFSDSQSTAIDQRRIFTTAKEQAARMTLQSQDAVREQKQQQQQRSGHRHRHQPGPSSSEELEQRGMADGRDSGKSRPAKVPARGPASATAVQPKGIDRVISGLPAPGAAAVNFAASAAGNPSAQVAPMQQQVQQQLQPPNPLYAAPVADAWAPPQPPVPAAESRQMVLDLSGSLQPWMCWFARGAEHALLQLIADQQIKAHLLDVVKATPEEDLPHTLDNALMGLLTTLQNSRYTMSPPVKEGVRAFINLLKQAVDMPRPSNPPMVPSGPATPPAQAPAAAAPSMVLPPHLLYMNSSQQQQSGGQLPYKQSSVQQSSVTPAQLQQQHQQTALPTANGNESDDEELLALVMADTAAVSEQPAGRSAWATSAQQQHGMPSSEFPSLGASVPGSRVGPAVSSAGLANETGEYNCFLNVVVQCLYSCTLFREQVMTMPVHEQVHPVVHALLQLFQQMHAAEQGWKPGHDRAVVNPTELREALDSDTIFRRREMNDANEFLECLFDCFKAAQGLSNTAGSRGVLIDGVFGILVNEKVRCTSQRCGVVSHVIPDHWEHLLMVNSAALKYAAQDARAELGLETNDAPVELGRLLRTLFDQEQKACDKEKGGCGIKHAPERQCVQTPRVLTLQLSWLQDVTGAEIGSALQHIQEDVDILDIYAAGVTTSDTTYHLSSAVAYYGQHYMAFVRNEKLNQWLMFDDASVSVVGSWEDVKRKCVNGRIQPSVLFYQVTDLPALPDRAAAPGVAHTAAPGLHHHPLQVAYTAAPVAAMAANGLGWGSAGAPMPPQIHFMHQPQQLPYPAAIPPGVLPHAAQLGPAVNGPPPPAAVSAAQHMQQWGAAGPDSGSGGGNVAAVDGWHSQAVAPGSSQDAWGPAAVPEPVLAAPSQAAAAVPTGRPSPVRGPAWGGAGRVAQQALEGIADQARYTGGNSAPGPHRGHGTRGRGERG